MRITIDTDILSRNNISLGEFLVLLLGYNNCNFDECFGSLVDKKLADIDKFTMGNIVLSDNSRCSKCSLESYFCYRISHECGGGCPCDHSCTVCIYDIAAAMHVQNGRKLPFRFEETGYQ